MFLSETSIQSGATSSSVACEDIAARGTLDFFLICQQVPLRAAPSREIGSFEEAPRPLSQWHVDDARVRRVSRQSNRETVRVLYVRFSYSPMPSIYGAMLNQPFLGKLPFGYSQTHKQIFRQAPLDRERRKNLFAIG